MKDIKTFCEEFSFAYDLRLITDTVSGLNALSDRQIADDGNEDLRPEMFLNVQETGTMSSNESGNSIVVEHSYEVGFFKRCPKETFGDVYYAYKEEMLSKAKKFFIYLIEEYDITAASYSSGYDELDSNNVCIKLEFNIQENIFDTCITD